MFIRIAASLLTLLIVVACTDERTPTEPQASEAPPSVRTEVVTSPTSSGTSSICLVNRRALASLDGQLQDNPNDEGLKAELAVQAAITADICD